MVDLAKNNTGSTLERGNLAPALDDKVTPALNGETAGTVACAEGIVSNAKAGTSAKEIGLDAMCNHEGAALAGDKGEAGRVIGTQG